MDEIRNYIAQYITVALGVAFILLNLAALGFVVVIQPRVNSRNLLFNRSFISDIGLIVLKCSMLILKYYFRAQSTEQALLCAIFISINLLTEGVLPNYKYKEIKYFILLCKGSNLLILAMTLGQR